MHGVLFHFLKRSIYVVIVYVLLVATSSGTVHARKPYVRVYGNDVIAGGGYGSGCTNDATDVVHGFGTTNDGNPATHANYIGAGAELAVISPSQISGFLPGAVSTTRSPLEELSFANDSGIYVVDSSLPDPVFGGGFGYAFCVDEFPEPLDLATDPSGNTLNPGWMQWVRTLGQNSGTVTGDTSKLDLSTPGDTPEDIICDYLDIGDSRILDGAKILIRNGGFHFGSGCDVTPGAQSPTDAQAHRNEDGTAVFPSTGNGVAQSVITGDGRTITVFIDGDPLDPLSTGELSIVKNILYQGASAGWASTSNIPLLKVYVRGNLKVDYSVNAISGMYFSGGNGTGHFWSCTVSSEIIASTNPPPIGFLPNTEIASKCNNPLTIYGTVVSNRSYLYRTTGDISSGIPGEGISSANIAEKIIFTPEVYLPLIRSSGATTIETGAIDAVRTLPPAF